MCKFLGTELFGPIHTGRAPTNSNANPLMLLVCSVDTSIHINRPHLLALRAHPVWIQPKVLILIESANFFLTSQSLVRDYLNPGFTGRNIPEILATMSKCVVATEPLAGVVCVCVRVCVCLCVYV